VFGLELGNRYSVSMFRVPAQRVRRAGPAPAEQNLHALRALRIQAFTLTLPSPFERERGWRRCNSSFHLTARARPSFVLLALDGRGRSADLSGEARRAKTEALTKAGRVRVKLHIAGPRIIQARHPPGAARCVKDSSEALAGRAWPANLLDLR